MSSPVKIDVLLEPLLTEASDEQADELLSQLIAVHAEPVIKGVIRFKLRLNSFSETQREEADDIHQEVVLQLLAQLQRFRKLPAVIRSQTCAEWRRSSRIGLVHAGCGASFPNDTRSRIGCIIY